MGRAILPSYRENTNGLVTWWPFDGGGTQDESGSGNPGKLILAPTVVDSPVLIKGRTGGSGYTFNGTTNYIVSTRILVVPTVTVSLWVVVNGIPGATGAIAGFAEGIGSPTFDKIVSVLTTTGTINWYIFDGATRNIQGTTNVCDNRPHLITCVADGTNQYIYVDGVREGSGLAGTTFTGYSVANLFLNAGGSSSGHVACTSFDFRIYNRGLSPGEVNALYNRGLVFPDEWEMPALSAVAAQAYAAFSTPQHDGQSLTQMTGY